MTMQIKLKKIRQKIDQIDKDLIFLLENRMALVKKVSEIKKDNPNICFVKAVREAEMVNNLMNSTNKISKITIFQIWRQIISLSLQTERSFSVNLFLDSKTIEKDKRLVREYFSALSKINIFDTKYLEKNTHKVEDIIICDRSNLDQFKFLLKNPNYKIFARLPDIDPDNSQTSNLNAIAKVEDHLEDLERVIISSKEKININNKTKFIKISYDNSDYYVYELGQKEYLNIKDKYQILIFGGFTEVFT